MAGPRGSGQTPLRRRRVGGRVRRAAKFQSRDGTHDDTATDITLYSYDNRNRMTSLTHYAAYGDCPDLDVAYSHDAYDRETEEKELVGGSFDERMIYDGTSVLAVLDSSNAVTERYLNGPAVDQVFAVEMVSSSGGLGPVNWLLADAQGTVRDVAQGTYSGGSTTAAVVDHLFYDAYGLQTTPQSSSDLQDQSPIGFAGYRYDALAGLYDTATRPYDPATGTWLQPDPIGYAAGDSNLYRYVGNDPTNEEDPSGMCSCGDGGSSDSTGPVGSQTNSGGGDTATPVAAPPSGFGLTKQIFGVDLEKGWRQLQQQADLSFSIGGFNATVNPLTLQFGSSEAIAGGTLSVVGNFDGLLAKYSAGNLDASFQTSFSTGASTAYLTSPTLQAAAGWTNRKENNGSFEFHSGDYGVWGADKNDHLRAGFSASLFAAEVGGPSRWSAGLNVCNTETASLNLLAGPGGVTLHDHLDLNLVKDITVYLNSEVTVGYDGHLHESTTLNIKIETSDLGKKLSKLLQ